LLFFHLTCSACVLDVTLDEVRIKNVAYAINFDLHNGEDDLANHTLSATFSWEVETLSEGNYGLFLDRICDTVDKWYCKNVICVDWNILFVLLFNHNGTIQRVGAVQGLGKQFRGIFNGRMGRPGTAVGPDPKKSPTISIHHSLEDRYHRLHVEMPKGCWCRNVFFFWF